MLLCWPASHAHPCPAAAPQAYKNREEAYTLLWPEKAEFVRMAAKFGATIVPFAAIGADEGVTQVRCLACSWTGPAARPRDLM